MLIATKMLITAAGHEMPLFMKGYETLLRSFATEAQSVRGESEVAPRELVEQKAKLRELERNVQLRIADAEKDTRVRKQLLAKEVELASEKPLFGAKGATLKAKLRECDQLKHDLCSARAAVGREERVIREYAELFCTGYTSSVCRRACGRLRVSSERLANGCPAAGDYLGGYRVRAGDDCSSLHLGLLIITRSAGVASISLRVIVMLLLFSHRHLLFCFSYLF